MDELPGQIADAVQKVDHEQRLAGGEGVDAQIEVAAGDGVGDEDHTPAQLLMEVVDVPARGDGHPDETLGNDDMEDHQPRQRVDPTHVLDVEEPNDMREILPTAL